MDSNLIVTPAWLAGDKNSTSCSCTGASVSPAVNTVINVIVNATANSTFVAVKPPDAVPFYAYIYHAFGAVGGMMNLFILCILVRRRVIPGKPSRWHLINQCVSDMLCCFLVVLKWAIGLNYTVSTDIVGDLICRIWFNGRFFWTSAQVSVLNMLSFTIERYMSVLQPHRHRSFFTARKLAALIAFMWLFSVGLQSLGVFQSDRNRDRCRQLVVPPVISYIAGSFKFVIYMVVPIPLMLYCNIIMVVTLLRPVAGTSHATKQRGMSGKERVARELTVSVILVGIVFALCTFPNTLYFALSMFGVTKIDLKTWFYLLTEFLLNIHFIFNRLICIVNMRAFRRELAAMFCCNGKEGKHPDATSFVDTEAVGTDSSKL